MRQDLKDELKRSAKLFLKRWIVFTLVFALLGVASFFIKSEYTDTRAQLQELLPKLRWEDRLWLLGSALGKALVAAMVFGALFAGTETLLRLGNGLRSAPDKGRSIFRVILGVRVLSVLTFLFFVYLSTFGVSDGIGVEFSWNGLLLASACIGSVTYVLAVAFRGRVEVAERAVYVIGWSMRTRRYPAEQIAEIQHEDGRPFLVLRSGKKVEFLDYIERPDELAEMLENMLKSRG